MRQDIGADESGAGYEVVGAIGAAGAPEGVVWYTGQFYAVFYMTTVLKVPYVTVYILMMVVLTLAAPFFVARLRRCDAKPGRPCEDRPNADRRHRSVLKHLSSARTCHPPCRADRSAAETVWCYGRRSARCGR